MADNVIPMHENVAFLRRRAEQVRSVLEKNLDELSRLREQLTSDISKLMQACQVAGDVQSLHALEEDRLRVEHALASIDAQLHEVSSALQKTYGALFF